MGPLLRQTFAPHKPREDDLWAVHTGIIQYERLRENGGNPHIFLPHACPSGKCLIDKYVVYTAD